MGILIKNIEMPKNCYECRFHSMQDVMHKARVIHLCYAQEIGQSCYEGEVPTRLHDGCPLVALPPHGDLIDVQAIEERAKEIQYERGITYKEALLLALDEASVVVEASE